MSVGLRFVAFVLFLVAAILILTGGSLLVESHGWIALGLCAWVAAELVGPARALVDRR